MREMEYIGKAVARLDARDKVTGRTKYAGDIQLPNLHYGKIHFSKFPRAKVLKIDASNAEKIPGVRAVITWKDIRGKNLYGYDIHHHPVLVPEGSETRFLGDSVAFVVAETPKIAEEASGMIEVVYEALRPICSPEEAMREGTPRIHKDSEGNVCVKRELIHGDVEGGFKECDVIIEQIYKTQKQEQAFLEPEAGVAFVDDTGTLHIYSALQDPYAVVEDVYYALGIPKSKIHVKGTVVGGGFGGKLDTTMQVHLATMTYIARVPVALIFTKEESFLFHPKRHPCTIKMKVGSTRHGRILALEGQVTSDAGPYSGRTPEVLGLTVSSLLGPYRIPHLKLTGTAYYTNNMESGAMRGFGAPQGAIARECILDKLAKELNLDPLELRRRNFLRQGDPMANPYLGESPNSLDLLTRRVSEKMGPLPEPKDPNKRVGRGFCFDMPVFDVSAIPVLGKAGVGITVEMFTDGSVSVYAGGTELGQGITTVLAQMAAEELGVPIDSVSVDMSDTRTSPRAGRTSASRLTFVHGNALLMATKKIRSTLCKKAAEILKATEAELVLKEGRFYPKGNPQISVDLKEVASKCSSEGVNLREEAWYRSPENKYMYGHTFMATAADVEVDVKTGQIRVLKVVNVHDTGKVINPAMAKGQLYGGTMQALGLAFMEDMTIEEGYLRTPSYAEYLIPTSMDVPDEVVCDFVETPYPTGPYGAKGIGEHSLNSTTPALLNAVFNATGVEATRLPILPDDIIEAYRGWEKKS